MSTRMEFLAGGAVTALAASTSQTPNPHRETSFHFDRERFSQILHRPAPHKQCFGNVDIAGGSVLFLMNNSIDAYADALAEGPGSLQAVAVFYHRASIFMALDDAFWNEMIGPAMVNLPGALRTSLADFKPRRGNPYLHSAAATRDDVSIESLARKGASFFVCNNALHGWSGVLADALGAPHTHASVYARALASIVPAAMVVPAGVMAINAAQEARFTYLQVSL